MTDQRVRERFAPEDLCRCGQRYDLHERRPGFGERPGRPAKLHCPGRHSWLNRKRTGEAKREYYFASVKGPGLPGGGPWRILPECTAEAHNTRRATESAGNSCICPRARAIVKAKSKGRNIGNILERALLKPNPHNVPVPDFFTGLCSRPENMQIADGGFSVEVTRSAVEKRMAAKRLCYSCPLLETVCGPFVRAAEDPPGSWRGVWAGMDPWERQGKRVVIFDGHVELVDAHG